MTYPLMFGNTVLSKGFWGRSQKEHNRYLWRIIFSYKDISDMSRGYLLWKMWLIGLYLSVELDIVWGESSFEITLIPYWLAVSKTPLDTSLLRNKPAKLHPLWNVTMMFYSDDARSSHYFETCICLPQE